MERYFVWVLFQGARSDQDRGFAARDVPLVQYNNAIFGNVHERQRTASLMMGFKGQRLVPMQIAIQHVFGMFELRSGKNATDNCSSFCSCQRQPAE